MKEPNYDRYDFAYRSILSRKDFFNETCLKGITKIHVGFSRYHDGHFKNAIAILRMVNRRRNKKHMEPLKIIFQNTSNENRRVVSEIYKKFVSNLLFLNHNTFPYNVDSSSQKVLIFISDSEKHKWKCRFFLTRGGRCYRLASVPKIKDLYMKTFGNVDEFYELLNEEICKRQNS